MSYIGKIPYGIALVSLVFLLQNCTPFKSGDDVSGFASSAKSTSNDTIASTEFLSGEGCNSTAFAQDPRDNTLFFGRRMYFSGLPGENQFDECTWQRWGVVTYRLNINTNHFTYLQKVVDLPARLADGRRINTAYDPTIVNYNGERLIAFECTGDSGFAGSVGACVGPVDDNNRLILSRTVVVIDGVSAEPNQSLLPSASVPKLMADGERLYLFWSQVLHTKTGVFQSVKTWGARLNKVGNFYWVEGSASAQQSDSPLTRLVYGNGQFPMADASDVVPFADHWLVLSHVGGVGCVGPLPITPNCYVMRLTWAQKAIETGSFDNSVAVAGMPAGSENWVVQYPRLIRDPRGGFSLLVNVVGEPTMRLVRLNLQEPEVLRPWKTGVVTQLFATILNRGPDQIAIDSVQSQSCSEIGYMVANSSEAHGIYASMDNSAFATYAYHRILMRAPDAEGLALHVNRLNNGITRVQLISDFVGSSEFRNWCRTNYNLE